MGYYRNGYCAKGHNVTLPGAKTNDGHCRICQKGYDRNKYLVKKAKRQAEKLAAIEASNQEENSKAQV